eukprot:gnl/Dysnectes_brevis/437_a480_5211.p1 GENE.gnl/Dysnectes_brevis/437_a480_5211~~gnl/Dysnectes_brevis/437_a480_5211.p1  ORF type:complete len:438 (+),score=148.06 gnl/Dysnectes_brevis/437_a480_5211:46-1359(+)
MSEQAEYKTQSEFTEEYGELQPLDPEVCVISTTSHSGDRRKAEKLFDQDLTTYWQSNASSGKHPIIFTFPSPQHVGHVFLYTSTSDDSYQPSEFILTLDDQPTSTGVKYKCRKETGWHVFPVSSDSLLSKVTLTIQENFSSGLDSRIRQAYVEVLPAPLFQGLEGGRSRVVEDYLAVNEFTHMTPNLAVVCKDGQEVATHRELMGQHSGFFRMLLSRPGVEQVRLPRVPAETFGVITDFLSSLNVNLIFSHFAELHRRLLSEKKLIGAVDLAIGGVIPTFRVASMLQMPLVVSIAEEYIFGILDASSLSLELFNWISENCSRGLLDRCCTFLVDNPARLAEDQLYRQLPRSTLEQVVQQMLRSGVQPAGELKEEQTTVLVVGTQVKVCVHTPSLGWGFVNKDMTGVIVEMAGPLATVQFAGKRNWVCYARELKLAVE